MTPRSAACCSRSSCSEARTTLGAPPTSRSPRASATGVNFSTSSSRLSPQNKTRARPSPETKHGFFRTLHLRVRPPRDLADLGVRVALGLQEQRPDLLRLQLAQRLCALAQPFVALGLVVGRGRRAAALTELAVVGDRRVALALAAQGEGLVLDHRLQPRHQLLLAGGGRFRQQD